MSIRVYHFVCLLASLLLLSSCYSVKVAKKIVLVENDTLQVVSYDFDSNEVEKVDFIQNSSVVILTQNCFENNKLKETKIFFNNNEISRVVYNYSEGYLSMIKFYEDKLLVITELYFYEFAENKLKKEVYRKDNKLNSVKFISYYIENKLVRQLEVMNELVLVEKIYTYDLADNLIEIKQFNDNKLYLIEKFKYDKKNRLVNEQRFQADVLVLNKINKYNRSKLKKVNFLDIDGYIIRTENYKYNFFNGLLRFKLLTDFRVFSADEDFRPSKTRYKYKYEFFGKQSKI